MNEVVYELLGRRVEIRRELATVAVQLAEVTTKELAADPGSTERSTLLLECVRLEARVWELRHLLYAATVARGVFNAEAHIVAFMRRHPSPTADQLAAARGEYEQSVKVAKRQARTVVAKSIDPDRAKHYLDQVEQRRRERRRERERGMEM